MKRSAKTILAFALRHRVLIPVVLIGIFLSYLFISHLLNFIHIFTPHSGIALEQADVIAAHEALAVQPDKRRQVVPKIIHQIFHNWKDPGNATLPADWATQRQTCLDLHPDWEFHLWDEPHSRDFIATYYAWFLPTYEGYRYPVQRIDALRYFLLYHYGGLYIDMDNGCKRSLEPLLYYPTFVIDPGHGTLMNNILGAEPMHPFWALMTGELQRYDMWYVFPFVSVMWGAGQWFETQIWEYYHRVILPAHRRSGRKAGAEGDGQLFRLMRDTRPGAPPPLFFTQGRGRSWDDWDKIYLEWIGAHIELVLFGGFALGVGAIALLVRYCCMRSMRSRVKKGQEYALLAS